MVLKRMLAPLCMVALVLCVFGASTADAYELPIVTGADWVASTDRERGAFLLGMATVIELEKQVQGIDPPFADHTLIDTWVKGLSPYTIKELRSKLDQFFADHPDQLDRPVVEVLWDDIALKQAYKEAKQ